MIAFLKSVFAVAIPIPLVLIGAAVAWAHFDKGSAVRVAVDRALKEAVAGAEIAALEARIVEERRIRAFAEGKAASEAEARKRFENERILAELEKEGLADELAEIKARPVNPKCVVDGPLFNGLRR